MPDKFLPFPDSLLTDFLPADYGDTFTQRVAGGPALTPEALLHRIFTDFPGWVRALMGLRNLLVKPLGLKGGGFEKHLEEMIRNRSDRETVFGMDDKHLAFHASVWCTPPEAGGQTAGFTTMVRFHNRTGRFYFACIRPFHKRILNSLLRNAVRAGS